MQRPRLKMRLGDLLVHEGIISEAQLQQLHQAARLLAGTDLPQPQLSAGAADD